MTIGSCDGAVHEALDILKRRGIQCDYMRIKAFPFGEEVEQFLASHSKIFVVEQNRDAQLRSLLTLETAVEKSKLRSILYYAGLPLAANVIVDGVAAELGASGAGAIVLSRNDLAAKARKERNNGREDSFHFSRFLRALSPIGSSLGDL